MDIQRMTPTGQENIKRIYLRYEKLIKSVAAPILQDKELTEDCLQELILKLSSFPDRVSEIDSPETKAFIIVVAKNIAKDMKKRRRRELCVDSEAEESELLFSESVQDSYFMDENGFSEEIHGFLDSLQEKERDAVILRYSYDLPYAQIAEILGEKKNTVEQRVSRIRKRLVRMIESEKGGE